jgi:hypothetical protein
MVAALALPLLLVIGRKARTNSPIWLGQARSQPMCTVEVINFHLDYFDYFKCIPNLLKFAEIQINS